MFRRVLAIALLVPLVVLMLATSLLGLLAKGLEMLEEQGLKVVGRLAG